MELKTAQDFQELINLALCYEYLESGLSQNEIAKEMKMDRGEVCKMQNKAKKIMEGPDRELFKDVCMYVNVWHDVFDTVERIQIYGKV